MKDLLIDLGVIETTTPYEQLKTLAKIEKINDIPIPSVYKVFQAIGSGKFSGDDKNLKNYRQLFIKQVTPRLQRLTNS